LLVFPLLSVALSSGSRPSFFVLVAVPNGHGFLT
jgi:hypothetical protein